MPFVDRFGNVAHGKGGVGAFYTTFNPDTAIQFDTGGGASWLSKDVGDMILYQHGSAVPNDWYVAFYNVRTGAITRAVTDPASPFFNVGVNGLYGGGGYWAGWTNQPGIGLFASTGLHLPHAGLLGIGPDGAIGYKPQYHSFGPAHVREVDGTDWMLAPGIVHDLQLLGQRRAIWTEGPAVVRTFGIPQPQILSGGCWAPKATFIQGEWWITYYNGARGVVMHPFNSFVGYSIVPTGDAWIDTTILDPTVHPQALEVIRVVWSITEGEGVGHIFKRDVNIVTEPRTNLNAYVITPINRAHWLGCFTGRPGLAGGWDTNDDPPEFRDAHALPGNGYLDVASGIFFSGQDVPVASFIANQPGWTVETMEAAALSAAYTPFCYWDGRDWPRWPNLPENSWLGLQAYCKRAESLDAFEASMRAILNDLRAVKPTQRVALVAQAYWQTPVNSLTDDLSGLVPILSRLAASFPNVIATVPFNGNGRTSGMQHHPEIRPLWDQLAATVPSTPPIEPVEDDMIKPAVTVQKWDLSELEDGREFIFEDTNNPDLAYKARVHVRDGSMYAEITNRLGTATTGMRRPVKPCEHDPDLPPPPTKTTTLKTAHGTFLSVNSAGTIINAAQEDKFEIVDLGGGNVALKAPNGKYVCAEAGGAQDALLANRDAIGGWETFLKGPSGDGNRPRGFTLKAVNGRYVAAEGDGRVTVNRQNGSEWETFESAGSSGGGGVGVIRGVVRADGKAVADDRGAFNAIAGTFFPLLWGLKFDRDRTLLNLDCWKGADAVRIFGCVGDAVGSWSDRIIDPNWPDYQDVLRDALRELKARGLRVIFTMIADVTENVPTEASRLAHVDRVLDVLLESPEMVLNIGVTNEGLIFDTAEALRLVAHIRSRSPFLVSSVASVDDDPATVFAGRTERKVTGDGGIWEHTEQPYDLKDTSRVASDEEPIGPQSSVAEDDDPLRNTAHAACALVCRAPIYVYHCGAGIRFGGAADLARGRHANFFDQSSFAPTLETLIAVRDFLPGDLANWPEVMHSNPRFEGRYPFKTGPLQPHDPSGWYLKTYANRSGDAFAGIFLKVEKDVPLEAFAAMHVEFSDLRGGLIAAVDLQANERTVVTVRGAFVFRGRWT